MRFFSIQKLCKADMALSWLMDEDIDVQGLGVTWSRLLK